MGFLRELNHRRIDLSKALLLKTVRALFDYQPNSSKRPLPDLKSVNKILVLHFDDKIGDLVVNSSLFRELKNESPEVSIDIVTGRNAYPLIKENPYIKKSFLFRKGLLPTLILASKLKKNNYNLVIDLRIMTDSRTIFILSRLGQNPLTFRVGLNKSNFSVYDLTIEKDFNQIHARERVNTLMKLIGISSPNLHYDLHFSKSDLNLAKEISHNSKFVILNPMAGARFRSLKIESVGRIAKLFHEKYSEYYILITGSPSDKEFLTTCENRFSQYKIQYANLNSLTSLCALVSICKGVISPDTSMVHIASCFNKNIIGLYRDDSNNIEKNSIQWAPTSKNIQTILCSGKTDGYLDVNTFSDDEFAQALNVFLKFDSSN
jgi:ADP-heptose:LPS heptosyltransferase